MHTVGLNEVVNPQSYNGEIEIIIKDKYGNLINTIREHNIIKIFAKEIISHRLPHTKIWDPAASSGSGAWVSSGVDVNSELSIKYILFGASFDANGAPLGQTDTRYYTPSVGGYIPVRPAIGADNLGDLINPISISEPLLRPLKKIEKVSFESSYQPQDSPLLSGDVRAINNVMVLETTLQLDEYNGFGQSDSDYFTITEVALAGGKELDSSIGACNCVPSVLFLEGVDGGREASIAAAATGTATIVVSDGSLINEGDQIMIVADPATIGSGDPYDTFNQTNPYYLVTSHAAGGSDVVLDRTPVDGNGVALTNGHAIGIFRSSMRIFSQRILTTPFTKSNVYSITVRWRIRFA